MKIGLFHGYNLTGSGSNEFTRYLARTFLDQGHSVHIICREYHPELIDYIGQLWQWDREGHCDISVVRQQYADTCTLHQIPTGDVYPVYVTDKQRSGRVKEFIDLTDEELAYYKALNHTVLNKILSRIEIDILHANHLVMQPALAAAPCKANNIPFIIYPHGSAIEYTVKKDPRYHVEARKAIVDCRGLIIGNHEVRDRICGLFPDLKDLILAKTAIVGVGVDTRLFQPTAKAKRAERIAAFNRLPSIQQTRGKSPALTADLYQQLQRKNYSAIEAYGEAYVHNSVDTNVTDKLATVDFNQPVIVFVGALTVGKGLQSLVSALPLVFKQYPGARLLIVGAGKFREVLEAVIYALAENDQELLRYLMHSRFEQANSSERELWGDVADFLDRLPNQQEYFQFAKRLREQVVFLGRFNHEQLSYIFPCADLAVFPSVIPEAYPLVLMESLANGVLPMVSYFSGFQDGVDELRRFLNVDLVSHMKIPMDKTRRVPVLASNIIYLLGKVKEQDLGNDLSQIAREHYDWSHRAQQMTAAYQAFIDVRQ
ncbi:MAG: glycosyltransferase family 4 protein [Gammaproteobacteria bacterium]|jgi:glycosyltransferase involved in cell wall biosynthesis